MSLLTTILSEIGPQAPKVLGVRLVPYTIGHALILQRLGSPYVFGGEIKPNDLAEAVIVCSQSPFDSIKTIKSPFKNLLLILWGFKISKMDLVEESKIFRAWIDAQSTAPEVLMESGSRKRLAIPWPERLLIALSSLGIDGNDGIEMPIGDAERLVLAHAEMSGKVDLWSDDFESMYQSRISESSLMN